MFGERVKEGLHGGLSEAPLALMGPGLVELVRVRAASPGRKPPSRRAGEPIRATSIPPLAREKSLQVAAADQRRMTFTGQPSPSVRSNRNFYTSGIILFTFLHRLALVTPPLPPISYRTPQLLFIAARIAASTCMNETVWLAVPSRDDSKYTYGGA
jgi:hypothetical protein